MTEQNKPKRCPFNDCKKRLLLTDFACKCGITYCASHRADTSHNCSFDWAKENTDKLTKNLQLVNGKKIETI